MTEHAEAFNKVANTPPRNRPWAVAQSKHVKYPRTKVIITVQFLGECVFPCRLLLVQPLLACHLGSICFNSISPPGIPQKDLPYRRHLQCIICRNGKMTMVDETQNTGEATIEFFLTEGSSMHANLSHRSKYRRCRRVATFSKSCLSTATSVCDHLEETCY